MSCWDVYTKCWRAAYRAGRDVREVGGDAGGVNDIIECQLVNEGAVLEEQRERLPEADRQVSKQQRKGVAGARGQQTWPMPPEAPATTTSREVRQRGNWVR